MKVLLLEHDESSELELIPETVEEKDALIQHFVSGTGVTCEVWRELAQHGVDSGMMEEHEEGYWWIDDAGDEDASEERIVE